MPKLGSKERPAVVRVQNFERAGEIAKIFEEHGWQYIAGVEPDKPENTSDLEKLLNQTTETVVAAPTPGRNEPCPCGSGKKYKKCCGAPA